MPPGFWRQPEKTENPEPLPEVIDTELVKIVAWRIDVLIREGGFDFYHAGRLAAIPSLDWREAVRLRKAGCKQRLVEEILA
jgi:hypothetical protein